MFRVVSELDNNEATRCFGNEVIQKYNTADICRVIQYDPTYVCCIELLYNLKDDVDRTFNTMACVKKITPP